MLQKWWMQVYKNATTAKLRHILIAKKLLVNVLYFYPGIFCTRLKLFLIKRLGLLNIMTNILKGSGQN